MDYAEVKDYLDGIVKDYRNVIRPRCLTNHIRATVSIDADVLMNEGLETVADIMGLEIEEEERKMSSGLVYQYSFLYDGVKFVGYEKERLARFVGKNDQ